MTPVRRVASRLSHESGHGWVSPRPAGSIGLFSYTIPMPVRGRYSVANVVGGYRDSKDGFTTARPGEALRGQVGYRKIVTALEVVLVMAGVPLAIMVLLGLLTLGPHLARTRRSRPGQKSSRPPVLWTVNREELRGGSTNHKIRGAVRKGDRGDG
jgi:hypothetical protein